jgi:hypothetical protein
MTTAQGETQVEEQGSQPAESQGKSGDETVPKTQFLAALSNAERKTADAEAKAARLEAELAAAKQQKPPTRAELLKHVEDGNLTQVEADVIWEKQMKSEVKAEVISEARHRQSAEALVREAQDEMAGYRELVPAVWEKGSPEYEKAAKEFALLVRRGMPGKGPEALLTEATAIRNAFGDVDTLRASKKSRTGPAETHAETGGSKDAGEGVTKEGVPKGLTSREKEHYEKGIRSGLYKDWKDVAEELKHATVRARNHHWRRRLHRRQRGHGRHLRHRAAVGQLRHAAPDLDHRQPQRRLPLRFSPAARPPERRSRSSRRPLAARTA